MQQEIFVVQNLSRNLLGRPASAALKLAVTVGAIFDNTGPIQFFPKLFQGLGKLEGEYVIELKDNHKPFAISVPRRVAVPLLDSNSGFWQIPLSHDSTRLTTFLIPFGCYGFHRLSYPK